MDTKAILISAVCVGLAIGVAGAPPRTTQPSHDDKLSDLIKPDPVLQARYDASVRELRQLEQAESDQIGSVVNPVAQAIIASGQPFTNRQVAMLNDAPLAPVAEFSRRTAPSIYEQSISATALGVTSLPAPSYDRSSAGRDFLARQSSTQSASRDIGGMFDTDMSSSTPLPNNGAIGAQTGRYYAPAGPNGYVSPRDGTYYSRSGPNGVINTRTGTYIPTVP